MTRCIKCDKTLEMSQEEAKIIEKHGLKSAVAKGLIKHYWELCPDCFEKTKENLRK